MKLSTAVSKMPVRLGAHWCMLALTVVLLGLVATFVDLKPVVDENFFFSTSDPQFQQSKKIEQRFPSQPEVILAVSSQDISSPRYLGRIQKLAPLTSRSSISIAGTSRARRRQWRPYIEKGPEPRMLKVFTRGLRCSAGT